MKLLNVNKITHIVCATITLAVLILLLVLNIVPGGRVIYVQDFSKRNPFVSDLWPPEALEDIVVLEDKIRARPFVKNEVTFFIRPPRMFERVNLTFDMIIPQGLSARLFVLAPDGNTLDKNTITKPINIGLYDGKTSFYLNPDWTDANKRYNIKIWVDGLSQRGEKAFVKKIQAEFVGDTVPLNFGVIKKIWELLR